MRLPVLQRLRADKPLGASQIADGWLAEAARQRRQRRERVLDFDADVKRLRPKSRLTLLSGIAP